MRIPLTSVVLVAFMFLVPAENVPAQEPAVIRADNVVVVDEKGDGRLEIRQTFPSVRSFHDLKQRYPNPFALLRFNFNSNLRAVFRDAEVKYDDRNRAVIITASRPGYAVHKRGRWELPVDAGFDLAYAEDGLAIFYGNAINPPFTIETVTMKLNLPAGSTDVAFDKRTGTLSYRLPRTPAKDGQGRLYGELEAREFLMSVLSKLYADPKLLNGSMWAGKALFTNDGDGDVTDLRISYRLGEYADWSSESRYDLVAPGGTVVDCYYPVFNDRVMRLDTPSPAYLEMKFSYRDSSGTLHEDSVTERSTVLDRTTFLFSNLPNSETVVWADYYANAPLLAAFVTRMDPVLREFAGLASQASGGAASHANDEQALSFMKAVYDQMVANGISYQSPAVFLTESASVNQSVKFPRDILRDKAGTCIDLAIFYAAACESNGLRTNLVLIPGHCFTMVRLPSGTQIPVENTGVLGSAIGESFTFEKAVELGRKNVSEATPERIILVDVAALQTAGVIPPNLPELPADTLKSWGIALHLPEKPAEPGKPQSDEKTGMGGAGGAANFGVWRLDAVNAANSAKLGIEVGLFPQGSGRSSYFKLMEADEVFPLSAAQASGGRLEVAAEFVLGGSQHVLIIVGAAGDGKWEGEFRLFEKATEKTVVGGPFTGRLIEPAGDEKPGGDPAPPPGPPAPPEPAPLPAGLVLDGVWEGTYGPNAADKRLRFEIESGGRSGRIVLPGDDVTAPVTRLGVEDGKLVLAASWKSGLHGNPRFEIIFVGGVYENGWGGEYILLLEGNSAPIERGTFGVLRQGTDAPSGGPGSTAGEPPPATGALAGSWRGVLSINDGTFDVGLDLVYDGHAYQGLFSLFNDEYRPPVTAATDVPGGPAVIMTDHYIINPMNNLQQPFYLGLTGELAGNALTGKCFIRTDGNSAEGVFKLERK